MKSVFLSIALLSVFVSKAQTLIDPDKLEAFNITVNYPEYTVKTQMLKDPAKITPQEEKTYNWYVSNKIMETKGGFDGKLLHGYYKCFYLTGNLKESGGFDYGLKSGKWSSWYTTGILREVIYWKKGVKNGSYRLYSESGELVADGNFENDRLDGKFKTFYNGKLADTKKYKDGVEIIKAPKVEGKTKTPFKEKLKRIFKKKPKDSTTPKEESKKEKPAKEKKPKEKKPKKEKKEEVKTVSK